VQGWIAGIGARTAYIEPGSSWENGYVEPFNGKLRDELLATEIFNALAEAKVQIAQRRQHFNTLRPQRPWIPAARAGGGNAGIALAAPPPEADRLSTARRHAPLKFCPDRSMEAGQ
jgi:transposase InsO family protein